MGCIGAGLPKQALTAGDQKSSSVLMGNLHAVTWQCYAAEVEASVAAFRAALWNQKKKQLQLPLLETSEYMRMYTHLYSTICIYTSTHTRASHISVYTFLDKYLFTCYSSSFLYIHRSVHVSLCPHMHIHICTLVCMCKHVCVYVHIHLYTSMFLSRSMSGSPSLSFCLWLSFLSVCMCAYVSE